VSRRDGCRRDRAANESLMSTDALREFVSRASGKLFRQARDRVLQRFLAFRSVAPECSEPPAPRRWRPAVAPEGGVMRPTPNVRARFEVRGSARVSGPAETPDRRSMCPQSSQCRSPHRPLPAAVMPESVGAPTRSIVSCILRSRDQRVVLQIRRSGLRANFALSYGNAIRPR
jgi:hypothetical protein